MTFHLQSVYKTFELLNLGKYCTIVCLLLYKEMTTFYCFLMHLCDVNLRKLQTKKKTSYQQIQNKHHFIYFKFNI